MTDLLRVAGSCPRRTITVTQSEPHDAKGILDRVISLCSESRRAGKYAEAAGPVLTSFGARFLARGMPAKVYEGGAHERCVVAEFESVDKAIAAYESPAYQVALAILKDACVREVRIVPGTGD